MKKSIGSVFLAFVFTNGFIEWLRSCFNTCSTCNRNIHTDADTLVSRSSWRLDCLQQPDGLSRLHRLRRPVCSCHLKGNWPPCECPEPLPARTPDRRSPRRTEDQCHRRDALANADIIIVGIAFNDTPWIRDDDPCDGPNGDKPDWSKYNATCAAAAAEIFRPKFESVFAQIVALREGKPTIFRTINRYNDWIGWTSETGETIPPEATNATRVVVDAWSAMICEAAQAERLYLCGHLPRVQRLRRPHALGGSACQGLHTSLGQGQRGHRACSNRSWLCPARAIRNFHKKASQGRFARTHRQPAALSI